MSSSKNDSTNDPDNTTNSPSIATKTNNDPFSRSSIYTPLAHIHKIETKRLPKNVKESALYETLAQTSTHYARSSGSSCSTRLEKRPAGAPPGKPLNAEQFREKLQGRGITVVQGYHHRHGRKQHRRSSHKLNEPTSVILSPQERSVCRRKRKHFEIDRSWLNDSKAIQRQVVFLQDLNQMWNEYMHQIILQTTTNARVTESASSTTNDTDTTTKDRQAGEIPACSGVRFLPSSVWNLKPICWIGARVLVVYCHAHKNWSSGSVKGILLEETVNTWVLAVFQHPTTGDVDDSSTPSFRYYKVPKRKTILHVLVGNNDADSVYRIELIGNDKDS